MNLSKSKRFVKLINIRGIFSNPLLLFTASRYFSYIVLFIYGIMLARVLGPFLFGVWGFLMLVRQYLSYTSLGLQYAINVELATTKEPGVKNNDEPLFIGTALLGASVAGGLLVLTGFSIGFFEIPIFEKYSFGKYVIILTLIVGLSHINDVFVNVYRVYYKLTRIVAYELLVVGLPLLTILLFSGGNLITLVLWAILLSELIGICLFGTRMPFELSLTINSQHLKRLLAIGVPLLVYNVSFYLIVISARTVVSIFYSVEIMGYYSLANNITNATLLGLRAVAWVLFPDILNRMREGIPKDQVAKRVQMVNSLYGTSVFLVVFVMILALPLLFFLLPEYEPVAATLINLLLAQAVLSMSFGYNCLAIARKQQLKVAIISLISVLSVTIVAIAVAYLGLNYAWVAAAVLFGALVFTILQSRLASNILARGIEGVKTKLPLGGVFASMFFFISALADPSALWIVIGVVVFVVFSSKQLKSLWSFSVRKLVAL